MLISLHLKTQFYFYVFIEHFEHLIEQFDFYIFTKLACGIYLHFSVKLIFVSNFISHPITVSIIIFCPSTEEEN